MKKTKRILIKILLGTIRLAGFVGRGLRAFILMLKTPVIFIDDLSFKIFILPLYKLYRLAKKLFSNTSLFREEIWRRWGFVVVFAALFVFGYASNIEASSLREDEREDLFFYTLIGQTQEEIVSGIKPGEQPRATSYLSGEAVLTSGQNVGIPVDYIEEVPLTAFGGTALIQPIVFVSDDSVAPRDSVEIYVVQNGDTISSIARKFGLNINTVFWANNLSSRSLIRPGDKLQVLPVDGILYAVKRGDTISKIAKSYSADSEKIMDYNKLTGDSSLKIGEKIIVPGGYIRQAQYTTPIASIVAPSAPKSNLGMIWPTTSKRITQYYSWKHTGVDIGGKVGFPIYAVDEGVVEYSGWGTGYGNEIVINHGNGIKTRYAHASRLFVKKGDIVEQGQVIMEMGSTGWSTGPHLHFEIYIGASRVNPLNYVR